VMGTPGNHDSCVSRHDLISTPSSRRVKK
jgi:hypothetical protein